MPWFYAPVSPSKVLEAIRKIQEEEHLTDHGFCNKTGINHNAILYLKEGKKVTRKMASKLHEVWGIPLDFFYQDDTRDETKTETPRSNDLVTGLKVEYEARATRLKDGIGKYREKKQALESEIIQLEADREELASFKRVIQALSGTASVED